MVASPRPGVTAGTPGAEPNCDSDFSGSAWEWDEAAESVLPSRVSRRQPGLNWENPEVRQAIYAIIR